MSLIHCCLLLIPSSFNEKVCADILKTPPLPVIQAISKQDIAVRANRRTVAVNSSQSSLDNVRNAFLSWLYRRISRFLADGRYMWRRQGQLQTCLLPCECASATMLVGGKIFFPSSSLGCRRQQATKEPDWTIL